MESSARISPCGLYRYSLDRSWDKSLPSVVFVMLNPSTADADRDDPTIHRVVGFAKSHGFGSLRAVNLFAYRATDPRYLWTAPDPVGPENYTEIESSCRSADDVVFAWGAMKKEAQFERSRRVDSIVRSIGHSPKCLGLTKDGEPRHPLYLPLSSKLRPWANPCKWLQEQMNG